MRVCLHHLPTIPCFIQHSARLAGGVDHLRRSPGPSRRLGPDSAALSGIHWIIHPSAHQAARRDAHDATRHPTRHPQWPQWPQCISPTPECCSHGTWDAAAGISTGGWRGGKWREMGVSENSVPLNPMVNDHYHYEKLLFHWEYTLFSDKPKWRDMLLGCGRTDCETSFFLGFRIPPGTTSQQGRWALSWGKNLKIAGWWELPLESDIIPSKTLFSIRSTYLILSFLLGYLI